jgi:FkbM family methyltransferase
MDDAWRTLVRTVQTSFPWLADVKYELQRTARRITRRPFENDFLALRLLDLGPDPLLLDVGANRGQSIDAFCLVRPGARIIAFEPNRLIADRLHHRYRRRDNIEIRAIGLGDAAGEFTLYIPVYKGYVFDGLASFDQTAARGWLEGRILHYDPARLRVDQITCPVTRLDDLQLNPAMVKLDIQGFEHRALVGSRETLTRYKPVLLIETPNAETFDYLGGLGYRCHAYRKGRLVADQTGDLNTFFLAS